MIKTIGVFFIRLGTYLGIVCFRHSSNFRFVPFFLSFGTLSAADISTLFVWNIPLLLRQSLILFFSETATPSVSPAAPVQQSELSLESKLIYSHFPQALISVSRFSSAAYLLSVSSESTFLMSNSKPTQTHKSLHFHMKFLTSSFFTSLFLFFVLSDSSPSCSSDLCSPAHCNEMHTKLGKQVFFFKVFFFNF